MLFETNILMECYQQLIEALILPRVGPIAQMANISFSSLASNVLHWLDKAAIRYIYMMQWKHKNFSNQYFDKIGI